MDGDDPTDDFAWLSRELGITAERAMEHGLTLEEFLLGLKAYANRLEEDHLGDAGD